ncbi:hotdog domain-containing protein [Desulfuromonas acetoxidans]|uniref:Thioesterase superfamily n=1 Tax=Desulfuromonas acetoxidans (strain DSM 684 / 11070) TaxID=281689 RepID=Q1K0U7_DESA6|nr:hotdog domain-containing protein [Desulfuromonas acetoxidans]EAT16261.1 thioesterase superfamily [Desulfuromonas acetoxidans DSM 684]
MTGSLLPTTHQCISPSLVGAPLALEPGKAVVELVTIESMVADPHGLVHGGFIFGLADYAAMLAVNEPTVVLGAAQTRFLAPVSAGETATATAVVISSEKNRYQVECMVKVADKAVFSGEFTCFVLEKHVLS